MFKECSVRQVVLKILAMEPDAMFNFCEKYDPEDPNKTWAHESWFGVRSECVFDNRVVVMAKYGFGYVGIVELGTEWTESDLFEYFKDLDYGPDDKILVEEDA